MKENSLSTFQLDITLETGYENTFYPRGTLSFIRFLLISDLYTGFLSQLRAKLRDWAVRPVRAGCYSWAALYLIDSKTLYKTICII